MCFCHLSCTLLHHSLLFICTLFPLCQLLLFVLHLAPLLLVSVRPPVSMILPLLGLCSFIISLLHSLASFLFLRVLLTKPWLADMCLLIMIPQCLRWLALSYSESLWKSLTSWTDARWDRVSLSFLGNCTVKWLCFSNNWVVLCFGLKVYFGYWV